MSGASFVAAMIGSHDDQTLGRKVVVPDHKIYFIPVNLEDEAHYLVGLLNAPTIAEAVRSYAAQLSLGTSVIEYLKIPKFDERDPEHAAVARLSKAMTLSGGPDPALMPALNDHAVRVIKGHGPASARPMTDSGPSLSGT